MPSPRTPDGDVRLTWCSACGIELTPGYERGGKCRANPNVNWQDHVPQTITIAALYVAWQAEYEEKLMSEEAIHDIAIKLWGNPTAADEGRIRTALLAVIQATKETNDGD